MAKLKLERLYELSRISQINGAKDGTPLWIQSDPGIGKTASVQAYCDSINNHCEVIILGRIPSIDIGGMYVPNMATGELDHFISRKLLGEIKGAEGKDGICIFFDELPNTTEEQQTAIQSLVQDRVLEGRKIPDNVWFIFAGNFTGSNCGANEVVLSLHDWVTGYNQYMKGEAFHSFDPGVSGAQPSPRKWTKLSNLLKIPGIDGQELQLLGQAEIGASQWAEFWGWVQLGQKVPVYEDVCNDPDDCPRPPDEKPDHQYAVIMNIAKGVKDAGDLITKEEVDSVLTYLRRLPEIFAAYDFAQRSSSVAVFTQEYGESIR